MDEQKGGIGAKSNKKKSRRNALEGQRRAVEQNTGREQEEVMGVDFGDNSTILNDWSLIYGMVCKVIKQRKAICWSRVLTCLLEAAYNKDKIPTETYQFSHEELVQSLKENATEFEVGSIKDAVKRIKKIGLVKLNSKNMAIALGGKFEVKANVNCAFLREQVMLSPVGIIIDVDSEFLDGTGKDFYKVRVIGNGAERHALIIIGFGRTEDGKFFFIYQNSWGKKWGFNGIGRLIIDEDCPIFIFYPTGEQLFG